VIELISQERCTACNICVTICPTNVFDTMESSIPVVARQADCQTCFMCEAYCPEDALYVAPDADVSVAVSERALVAADLLGSYRAALGWTKGAPLQATRDAMHKLVKSF
jgi:NAD-dependent dihydropyrimidine dehydrogenase PreA subunit